MAGGGRGGPPPGLEIRPARDGDAAFLADLCNLFNAPINGGEAPMTAERVRCDWLAPGPFGVLVAVLDGRSVGYALHGPAYESAFAARGRFLNDLAVAPGARRRGVGRALIARLARLTRDEGGSFLWWVNSDALPDGLGLYRGLADVEDRINAFAVTRAGFAALADED